VDRGAALQRSIMTIGAVNGTDDSMIIPCHRDVIKTDSCSTWRMCGISRIVNIVSVLQIRWQTIDPVFDPLRDNMSRIIDVAAM